MLLLHHMGAVTLTTGSSLPKVGQAPEVSRPGPISKHLSEEAVGCEHVDAAGTDACLCALLPISGSQGRNGGVQGTGGGRSAGLAHKISFSTLSQYC